MSSAERPRVGVARGEGVAVSALVDLAGLEGVARGMSADELAYGARMWGQVLRWAEREGVPVRAAYEAFPAVAEAELARRREIARAAGELFDGRWSVRFDVEIRAMA